MTVLTIYDIIFIEEFRVVQMLNIHIALNNNLCESQLNITDILSIAIPILCVLLTLLLTIFLSFLSDRRKLRLEKILLIRL